MLLLPLDMDTVATRTPTIDWDDVAGATSYTIQISTSANFGIILMKAKVVDSTFTPVTNPPKGKEIYWRVRANGPNRPSNWSDIFELTTLSS